MKSLVVYSSRTGNTRKVAEAVFDTLPEPKELYAVEDAPPPDEYDFVAVGFWVDKGMPDAGAKNYMPGISGKRVGLFGTLGAWPDSDHARESMRKAKECLGEDNTILGDFLCQGRIDPRVLEIMRRQAAKAHPMTPEREARIKEAEKHPDERDLENARLAFRGMVNELEVQACGR